METIHNYNQDTDALDPNTVIINGRSFELDHVPGAIVLVIEARRIAVAQAYGLDFVDARRLTVAQINAGFFDMYQTQDNIAS